jgi:hypothetical protein
MASAGESVRLRITCQRIAGSASGERSQASPKINEQPPHTLDNNSVSGEAIMDSFDDKDSKEST